MWYLTWVKRWSVREKLLWATSVHNGSPISATASESSVLRISFPFHKGQIYRLQALEVGSWLDFKISNYINVYIGLFPHIKITRTRSTND